jgi:hypothetical protein
LTLGKDLQLSLQKVVRAALVLVALWVFACTPHRVETLELPLDWKVQACAHLVLCQEYLVQIYVELVAVVKCHR